MAVARFLEWIHHVSKTWQYIWETNQSKLNGNGTRLVYFEECGDAISAFEREKNMKSWNRTWKIELITKHNPTWKDLYYDIV